LKKAPGDPTLEAYKVKTWFSVDYIFKNFAFTKFDLCRYTAAAAATRRRRRRRRSRRRAGSDRRTAKTTTRWGGGLYSCTAVQLLNPVGPIALGKSAWFTQTLNLSYKVDLLVLFKNLLFFEFGLYRYDADNDENDGGGGKGGGKVGALHLGSSLNPI
jgi:hypothetical protein